MPFKIAICVLAAAFGCFADTAIAAQQLQLNPEAVVARALTHNRAIRVTRLQSQSAGLTLEQILGPYDIVLQAEVNQTLDESDQVVPIFGTSRKETNFNFALLKQFDTGTKLSFGFDNQRESTNSTFATLNPAWESRLALDLNQSLLKNSFGYRERLDLEAAARSVAAATADYNRQIEDVVVAVLANYFTVLQARENVRITRESEKVAKRLLDTNRKNAKYGLVEKVDLLSYEANWERARNQVLIAEDDLQAAESMLRTELVIDGKTPLATPKIAPSQTDIDLAKSQQSGLLQRKDLMSLRQLAKEKKLRLAYWKADRLPTLDLVASFRINGIDDDYGNALSDKWSFDHPSGFFGLRFENVFGQRASRAERKRSELEQEQVLLQIKQTEFSILMEVERHYRTVLSRRQQVEKQQKILDLQKGKFREEEKRMGQGRGNVNFLIQYQEEAVQAALFRANAIIQYELARLDLSRAGGTLLEDYSAQ